MKNRLLSFLIYALTSFSVNGQNNFATSSGNEIKSVKIGHQEWMLENLNVDKFRNGDPIPHAKSSSEWEKAGKEGKPAWCYFDNDKTKARLYNWYAINDPRGLAPQGWRIPSTVDWYFLLEQVEGRKTSYKLRSKTGWGFMNGSNESGFNAYPCGTRNQYGDFSDETENSNASFWSSKKTEKEVTYLSINDKIGTNLSMKKPETGMTVRCIKGDIGAVTVGNKTWTSENLDVETFSNGDPIQQAKTKEEWVEASIKKQPAWCYYDFDPYSGMLLGKLYNWYAVNDSRGLAPKEWKVASALDWEEMYKHAGTYNAGKKLKSKYDWKKNNDMDGNGTNEHGFNALPGGNCDLNGNFGEIETTGYWWTLTGIVYFIKNDSDLIKFSKADYSFGFSIRCVHN